MSPTRRPCPLIITTIKCRARWVCRQMSGSDGIPASELLLGTSKKIFVLLDFLEKKNKSNFWPRIQWPSKHIFLVWIPKSSTFISCNLLPFLLFIEFVIFVCSGWKKTATSEILYFSMNLKRRNGKKTADRILVDSSWFMFLFFSYFSSHSSLLVNLIDFFQLYILFLSSFSSFLRTAKISNWYKGKTKKNRSPFL